MNTGETSVDRVEDALKKAHGSIPQPDLGPLFAEGVMAGIRSAQAATAPASIFQMFDRILLPFACSCAAAALVLAIIGVAAYQSVSISLLEVAYATPSSIYGLLSAVN